MLTEYKDFLPLLEKRHLVSVSRAYSDYAVSNGCKSIDDFIKDDYTADEKEVEIQSNNSGLNDLIRESLLEVVDIMDDRCGDDCDIAKGEIRRANFEELVVRTESNINSSFKESMINSLLIKSRELNLELECLNKSTKE